LFICIFPTPLYHLHGSHPKPTTFWISTHRKSLTFLHSYLNSIRRASDALGQVCVTLQHPPLSCGWLIMGGLVLGGLVL
jgi:hypothetical protein